MPVIADKKTITHVMAFLTVRKGIIPLAQTTNNRSGGIPNARNASTGSRILV
jgi:hypothetical protein